MDGKADLIAGLVADLRGEGDELDALVAPLPAADWARATPAAGWTIAHQIGHLAWTDERATLSATDQAGFLVQLQEFARSADPLRVVDAAADELARIPPARLLERWRAGRGAVAVALASAQGRLPWFGPPMSPASMLSARLMETWAHAQDIADTLGVARVPTGRLRHIAHVSIGARDFAYHANGLDPPGSAFRVELAGPDGQLWTWGDEAAGARVTGPALDFCLLATQRRHRADLRLVAEGAEAEHWLDIIQAFAGPPGAGRAAGQFTTGPGAA